MSDCIFCKIIKGEIPSKKVYEDDKVLAFHDINPEAPVHVLVVPKEHIDSVNGINESNADVISHIFLTINYHGRKTINLFFRKNTNSYLIFNVNNFNITI